MCSRSSEWKHICVFWGQECSRIKLWAGTDVAEMAECRLAKKRSLEMGICSSASTWVDCGLVGMLFLFYVNLSFSAVNILTRPVVVKGCRNWAQYLSCLHLLSLSCECWCVTMSRHRIMNNLHILSVTFLLFYCNYVKLESLQMNESINSVQKWKMGLSLDVCFF